MLRCGYDSPPDQIKRTTGDKSRILYQWLDDDDRAHHVDGPSEIRASLCEKTYNSPQKIFRWTEHGSWREVGLDSPNRMVIGPTSVSGFWHGPGITPRMHSACLHHPKRPAHILYSFPEDRRQREEWWIEGALWADREPHRTEHATIDHERLLKTSQQGWKLHEGADVSQLKHDLLKAILQSAATLDRDAYVLTSASPEDRTFSAPEYLNALGVLRDPWGVPQHPMIPHPDRFNNEGIYRLTSPGQYTYQQKERFFPFFVEG